MIDADLCTFVKFCVDFDQMFLIRKIKNYKKEIALIDENLNKISYNQIDIISGSLANIIQEFQKVEMSFSDMSENLVRNKNTIKGKKSLSMIMPRKFSINIDEDYDLEIAKYLLKKIK